MTVYPNAGELAYLGYYLTCCPQDDEGNVADASFFQRFPALEAVLMLTVTAETKSMGQVDLVDPFSDELPTHYGCPF